MSSSLLQVQVGVVVEGKLVCSTWKNSGAESDRSPIVPGSSAACKIVFYVTRKLSLALVRGKSVRQV